MIVRDSYFVIDAICISKWVAFCTYYFIYWRQPRNVITAPISHFYVANVKRKVCSSVSYSNIAKYGKQVTENNQAVIKYLVSKGHLFVLWLLLRWKAYFCWINLFKWRLRHYWSYFPNYYFLKFPSSLLLLLLKCDSIYIFFQHVCFQNT